MGSYQTSIYEGYERMSDFKGQVHLKSYGIKEYNLMVLMLIAGLMVGYILRNETHITYSGDNFLKVKENYRGEIAKVERCTFDRGNFIQGMRPYYTCNVGLTITPVAALVPLCNCRIPNFAHA